MNPKGQVIRILISAPFMRFFFLFFFFFFLQNLTPFSDFHDLDSTLVRDPGDKLPLMCGILARP
jgi:hypothetical protein